MLELSQVCFFPAIEDDDDRAVTRELKRWKSLNECELVKALKLNQLVALQRPYFTKIPFKRRRDEDALEGTEKCLRLIEEKG